MIHLSNGEKVDIHYRPHNPPKQQWEAVTIIKGLFPFPDCHAIGETIEEAVKNLEIFIRTNK